MDTKGHYVSIYTNHVITKWELHCDVKDLQVAIETDCTLLWVDTVNVFFQAWYLPQDRGIFIGMIGKLKTPPPFIGEPGDGATLPWLPLNLLTCSLGLEGQGDCRK